MANGGGGRHWQEDETPDFRTRMCQRLVSELAQLYPAKLAPNSQELQSSVAKFEDRAFNGAKSKEEYLRRISNKLVGIGTRRRLGEQQRSIQIGSQVRPTNAVQALQGGSSSVTAMPQAARMTPQTSGLVPNQHLVDPCTPNMQIDIKQEQPEMMSVVDQYLNFQPITSATTVPGVQPVKRSMQSVTHSQNQHPSRPKNYAGLNPTGVAKLQGHPVVRSNAQQNHLISKNASDIGTQQPQHRLRANQQEIDMQKYQMLGAQQASVSKMQTGYPGGQKNQQSAGLSDVLRSPLEACKSEPLTLPQQRITGGHQSSLLSQIPQVSATLGSSGEVDQMEKMFQQIKFWKDTYFLDFMELDRRFVVPKLTEEQLRSLPREKADEVRQRVNIKKAIRKTLNFLQLQKNNVPKCLKEDFPKCEMLVRYLSSVIGKNKAGSEKMNTGHHSQNCCEPTQIINCSGDAAPFTGGKSRPQEQPADASIFQSTQTIVTRTPPACQQNHSNHFLGSASPSFPTSSPGALQSLPTNKLECLTPSSVAKSGVVPVASSCASVKSTLTVAKLSVAPVASRCSSVKSKLSKDSDDLFAFFFHDNAVAAATAAPKANGSNHVTPTKLTMSASPLQAETVTDQAEDQVRGGGKPPVAKKPVDRLIEAMRSSSPAVLCRSVNSIWSVISMSDIAPHENIATSLGCFFLQQQGASTTENKMKRVFDHATPHSDSSMDGSCMTFECNASDSGFSSEPSIKRQKSQDAKDGLLEEIKTINSTLIDTVISMPGDCGTDALTSCNGGTMIKLSYNAVSLSPGLKSLFGTSEMSLVMPAKLFIPVDYPSSSPVLVDDKGDDLLSKKFSAFSHSVDVAFRRSLRDLPEPRSIKETAMAWDACVRNAVIEFAHRHGGGTISSRVGRWERCASA